MTDGALNIHEFYRTVFHTLSWHSNHYMAIRLIKLVRVFLYGCLNVIKVKNIILPTFEPILSNWEVLWVRMS